MKTAIAPLAAAGSLPPCGGGFGRGVIASSVLAVPPSLSLPHKGGGNGVALVRVFFGALLAAVVSIAATPALAQRPTEFPPVEQVTARHGMVVAQETRAARIGADVLRRGGNAVDAAVATGFAMAVTYPRAGNLGGGGFMIIHLARRHRDIAIDYRETAPAATTKDTFLNAQGQADPAKSRDQGLAIGVPGTVAGLTMALEKYGSHRFTPARSAAPA